MPRKKVDFRAALDEAARQPEARPLSFRDLCAAYMAANNDGATYMVPRWLDEFGQRFAWDITSEELAICRDAMLKAGYAAATANRELGQLGTIYRWAKRQRLVPRGFRSPTWDVGRLTETVREVAVSDQLVQQLLDVALAFPDRRFGACVRLLVETGARLSEIADRIWNDVDLDALTINTTAQTKTGKPRILHFSAETAALLKQVFPRRDPEALLFEGRVRGVPINYRKSWLRLVAMIGRPDLQQRDLRHVRAVVLLRQRNPIATVSQILGHSSTVLMQRYGHLENAHLQDAQQASFALAREQEQGRKASLRRAAFREHRKETRH